MILSGIGLGYPLLYNIIYFFLHRFKFFYLVSYIYHDNIITLNSSKFIEKANDSWEPF